MGFAPPFPEGLCYLCNILYYCYCFASSLLSRIPRPWAVDPGLDRTHYQSCIYSSGEEGRCIDKELASLRDVQFAGLDSNSSVRAVGWSLAIATSSIQHEGVVTPAPREVVDRESIRQGKEYSGIFRIVSYFESPSGGKYTIQGTAFAVSTFHVLTSAHLMWHPKLGPAKRAILNLDEREDQHSEHGIMCAAVTCHANWIRRHRAENDFCMVAVAKPFNPGVCIRQCHSEPGSSTTKDGIILGFPFDLALSRRLIQCRGPVMYRKRGGIFTIEHMINTVKGNSGGPVIVDGQVVGIHSEFVPRELKNKATPINLNGNNLEHFGTVLECITQRPSQLPESINNLGEVVSDTHPDQKIWLFT